MWDGWEDDFAYVARTRAALPGYRRDFNKGSVRNWGSTLAPCPTLGLVKDDAGLCLGMAFKLPENERTRATEWLQKREGRSFFLEHHRIRLLPSNETVIALVAVNDTKADTYLGATPLSDRAKLIANAQGTSGGCLEYLTNIRTTILELEIVDPAVEQLWKLVTEDQDSA